MAEEVLTGATHVRSGRSFVDDLRAFDQQAWGQVYDQHFQSLFFYALSRIGDRGEAEDQAAQVLEQALRGIDRYQERGVPFRAWLFAIARNVVADHIKRRQRERGLPASNADQAGFESGVGFKLSLQRALRHVSEEQRQVVVLRFVSDLSLKECAQTMGKSVSAIKSLQNRGFERLREYYEKEEGVAEMNDEILQEMIRSCSNAEDVQEFVSRTGLELTSSELRAVTAVVDFRAAGLANEASANRRAAFLGRVALQRTQEPEARRPWSPWIRRMAFAAVAVAALGAAAVGGANADAVGEALGLRDEKNVYQTTSFQPGFSVTLPNDNPCLPTSSCWGRPGLQVDKNDAFVVEGYTQGVERSFGIYKPIGWADPSGRGSLFYPGDLIAWLQRHPRLEAGEPTTVTVGGIEGTQIDVEVVCANCAGIFDNPALTQQQFEEALRNESVTLFHLDDPFHGVFDVPNYRFSPEFFQFIDFKLFPETRYRIIVFEVYGEDLVVIAPEPPPCIDLLNDAYRCPDLDLISFERVIQPILDSLVFEATGRRTCAPPNCRLRLD